MKIIFILAFLIISIPVWAGIFDEADVGDSTILETSANRVELNGFLRGVYYGGLRPDNQRAETKSGYAEAAFFLGIRQGVFGDAFAEMRIRNGSEFNECVQEVGLAEAYIKTYLGRFDFIFGQQVVTWGRADGFNPTDNIVPRDILVRSPDEDDRRCSNFLLRSYYNLQPVRMEALWIPFYASSVLPIDLIPLPPNVEIGEEDYPD